MTSASDLPDTTRFYDDLAEYYDLIYVDWEASMRRHGSAIDSMLRRHRPEGPEPPLRLLDVAAGIGTQALPLAALGYDVTARDLSAGAIERLRREAAKRQLTIDAAVADMRVVADSVTGPFDAVIAFDNSVPHLLDDAAVAVALRGFLGLLKPGGVLLLSVRDYDAVNRASTSIHPYGERERAGRKFRLGQEWHWNDPSHYRTTLVIEERVGDRWDERVRTDALYYAISLRRILELMWSAGFADCAVSNVVFFQPVLEGRRAG